MTIPAVATLLHDQIVRIWSCGEVERVDLAYGEDVIDHMPIPGQPGGRGPLKDVVRLFRDAIPDLRMELHGVVEASGYGLDYWTLTGIHLGPLFGAPPTGCAVRFSGVDMVRVRDGRIRDIWHVEDMARLQAQIGLPPGPAAPPAPMEPDPLVVLGHDLAAPRTAARLARLRARHEAVWGAGASDDGVHAPGCVDHFETGDAASWRAACPDLTVSLHAVLMDGDRAGCRFTLAASRLAAPFAGAPAASRPFRISGLEVVRFDTEDRIAEVWRMVDRAGLHAQLTGAGASAYG